MKPSLDEVISTIARQVIAHEHWFDLATTLGVSVKDWPSGSARSLVEQYLQLRDQHNHQFAFYTLAEAAQGLRPDSGVPLDPQALKACYGQALALYRTKCLAARLQFADISEVEGIINDHLLQKTSELRTFNLVDQMQAIIEHNEQMVATGRALVELPGWEFLSRMVGGFNPGRVGMLVADTGFGKTTLALNLAISACQLYPVMYVNMEMVAQDIGEKILMSGSRTSFSEFKKAQYDFRALTEFADKMRGKRLIYTDGKSMSTAEIFALARKERISHGLGMLFVDYDQKITLQTSRDTPEWKALQIVMAQLEELAKELEIYVVLMSQSNDDGDPSGSKRSKYSASTVLRFYQHDESAVIEAVKNRFGKKGHALKVDYKADRASVKELSYIEIEKKKRGKL